MNLKQPFAAALLLGLIGATGAFAAERAKLTAPQEGQKIVGEQVNAQGVCDMAQGDVRVTFGSTVATVPCVDGKFAHTFTNTRGAGNQSLRVEQPRLPAFDQITVYIAPR